MKQEFKQLCKYTYYLEAGENDRPIIGYIKGNNYSLLIDGANSAAHAKAFLEKISEEEQKKIHGVLLTHWHWDHIFGSKVFGCPIYGQEKTARALDEMRLQDWSLEGLQRRHVAGRLSDFSFGNQSREIALGGRGPVPNLDVVVGRTVFDLGGVHVVYEEITASHVDGCYVAYIPEDKVLFLGDCLWPNMTASYWFYDIVKTKEMQQQIMSYDAEIFIDSHGKPVDRETMGKWLERLVQLVSSIFYGLKSYDEAVASLPEDIRDVDLGFNDCVEIGCKNLF